MERNMRWSCIIILFEIYEFEEHKMVKLTQDYEIIILYHLYKVSIVANMLREKSVSIGSLIMLQVD